MLNTTGQSVIGLHLKKLVLANIYTQAVQNNSNIYI